MTDNQGLWRIDYLINLCNLCIVEATSLSSLLLTTPQGEEGQCIWFLLYFALIIALVFIIWGITSNHFISILFGITVIFIDLYVIWGLRQSV